MWGTFPRLSWLDHVYLRLRLLPGAIKSSPPQIGSISILAGQCLGRVWVKFRDNRSVFNDFEISVIALGFALDLLFVCIA